MGVLFVGGGFGGCGKGGEAEAVGVEAGHELPGIDDLRWLLVVGAEGSGFGPEGGKGEARMGWGGVRVLRWVEGEEAIGGGGEGDYVVAQC